MLLFICTLWTPRVFGQIETSERNFSESKALLKEIIKDNNFRNGNADVRLGYFSLVGDPRGNSVQLNGSNSVPYMEFDLDYILYKRWGFVGTYQRAQNLWNSGEDNSTSSSQNYYTIGAIYKRILDESNIKNSYSIEFKYFNNSNDFKTTRPEAQFVKAYSGYMISLKRVVPATESFDIKGALDIIYIQDSETEITDSTTGEDLTLFKKTGTGLAFDVTGYYNFTRKSRLGLGLGILAYFNSIKESEEYGKNSYSQSYRSLYFSYNYLY